MTEICKGLGPLFIQMAREQDAIGWHCFMEGTITRCTREIQSQYHNQEGTRMHPDRWTQGLILKLLEATHDQWIY